MRGDITVVGGGWSVANVALDALAGLVIAVNDSALYVPRWNFAVSMDRLWVESRHPRLLELLGMVPNRHAWLRRSAVQNFPTLADQPQVKVFECNHEATHFSADPETLNGTNSGACALNLAWQLMPTRLFLLGFDMNRDSKGRAYWYPPYPWTAGTPKTTTGKYNRWAKEFGEARKAFDAIGTRVYNVSPGSSIDTFEKITPTQYRKECA